MSGNGKGSALVMPPGMFLERGSCLQVDGYRGGGGVPAYLAMICFEGHVTAFGLIAQNRSASSLVTSLRYRSIMTWTVCPSSSAVISAEPVAR
jgi:hypothetical protein